MTDVNENMQQAGATLLKMLEKWLMMTIFLTHKILMLRGMFVIHNPNPFGSLKEIYSYISV